MDHCPICKTALGKQTESDSNYYTIKCYKCGSFMFEEAILSSKKAQKILSTAERRLGGIVKYQNTILNKMPRINRRNLEEYIKNPIIPSIDDFESQLKFLLAAMKARAVIAGHNCTVRLDTDFRLAFAYDEKALESLLISLEEDGIIEIAETKHSFIGDRPKKTFKEMRDQSNDTLAYTRSQTAYSFKITRKGWSYSATTKAENKAFIAIDFDDSMDEAIEAIKMGITECGYHPMVIKNEDYPETIMEKALGEIRKSSLIIVDITNLRQSVFYEAGFAMGINKPVFYLCSSDFRKKLKEKGKEFEFYTKQYRIRFYKNHEELRKTVSVIIEANFPIQKK